MNHLIKFSKFIIVKILLFLFLSCSQTHFDLPLENQNFDTQVTYNSKVDILFMIDNSTTMQRYQSKLIKEVDFLIQKLNLNELDYRIATVSSDLRPQGSGGKLIGTPPYLVKNSMNLHQLLKERISLGEVGSDIESGLGSIKMALESPIGKSFLRSDALLAIIILTNEDDYSLGSVKSYIDFFDHLKKEVPGFSSRGWILNFIGITDLDGLCKTAPGFKEVGLRYIELADISGGIKASICDVTLSDSVSNIQKRIVQILSEYPLKYEPNLNTMKVYINNQLVPRNQENGWWYIPELNVIRFYGHYLPKPSDKIQVDYKPIGGN